MTKTKTKTKTKKRGCKTKDLIKDMQKKKSGTAGKKLLNILAFRKKGVL
ncbi:hypothetical protein [Chitinophaga rhizosphaerae]|nr:hypothetical protein [Chitinophaga rhizosphaerae]